MYNIIDLFSGAGGLAYGFSHHPEFNIIMANEINKDISTAYQLNHPNTTMLNCDISLITPSSLSSYLPVDIIIGGPPCQSYSTIGKRQLDDRANLFLQYKRILSIATPIAFVFENVTGILSMDKCHLFPKIQQEFSEIGYTLKYKVLDAADYGVPQHRERVILVGFKGSINPFEYPEPTHGNGKLPYITLKDAIGDLPILQPGESSSVYSSQPINDFLKFVRRSQCELTEHNAPNNNSRLIEIMRTLKDGEGKNSLPEEIRPKSGYGNTYAKLWWNKPSTTITRNFSCPSSSRCIHPRDSRALTIREGARLQSFPDDYRFYGSNETKRLEIGNAVPPLLSITIADSMLKAMLSFK